MANASRIALAWVTTVIVLVTISLTLMVCDPQILMWKEILIQNQPDMKFTSDIIIAVWRMSMLTCAVGSIIWAVITSMHSEGDSFEMYIGG